jgi:hypothetical protein
LACGGRDRFAIHPGKGVFNCRGCGRGGAGAIDLEMFLSGATFAQAIVALLAGEPIARSTNGSAESKQQRRQRSAAELVERIGIARSIWSRRRPPQGTLVEIYLRARGYSGIIPATIGFLPATEKYPTPAMIAAYAMPVECDGELLAPEQVMGVHITRLLPDGSDRCRDRDADGREKKNKISIGNPSGTPIALSCIGDGLSLVVSEGVEDGLAFCSCGHSVWAAGAAPYMPSLPIPSYVETLVVEMHPDESGRRYTARLCDVLRARLLRAGGRPIEIIAARPCHERSKARRRRHSARARRRGPSRASRSRVGRRRCIKQ